MFEVIIDTTDKCFMNCKYCGTNSNNNGTVFLNYNKIIEIISATKKLHKNHIIYFGGGCFFCHSHWKEILEANKNINANIRIDIPLHLELQPYLNKYNADEYNYSVSLSLWGVDDVHNSLSRSNSFSLFDSFVGVISEYQDELYLSFVITKELINQKDRIISFINKLDIPVSVYFHRLMPVGRCNNEYLPEQNEIKVFCEKIRNSNKDGVKVIFHHTIFSEYCRAFKNRIFINHDGNVYGCGWINDKTGSICNINETDISSLNILKKSNKYNSYVSNRKCPMLNK